VSVNFRNGCPLSAEYVIGGLIVERENLVNKIKGNKRYNNFNEPDISYHGMVYSDSPVSGILFTFRARMVLLRDTGATLSPFNAWIFIQGLETLPLRIIKHSENALKIAEWLENLPNVKKVNYPFLKTDNNYENAKNYMGKGASGLLSFEVDTFETAKKILDNVKIFSIVANIGDSKSIINHSASTTHQQLNETKLIKAGISKGLIRLSVGIEAIEDLIEDLNQSFQKL